MSTTETLSSLVARSLSSQYERVRHKVHALAEPLSIDQLWQRPYAYGNSVGHLLLHLTGNLSYYIGARIAGTGYVRDRPKEFADPSRRPREDVLRDFDRAIDMVLEALAAQRDDDWRGPYDAVGAEGVSDRLTMFVRCAAHADHHAGQIIYLCKQLALDRGTAL
jgi:uncharacterized damage-inducible protein DinB